MKLILLQKKVSSSLFMKFETSVGSRSENKKSISNKVAELICFCIVSFEFIPPKKQPVLDLMKS